MQFAMKFQTALASDEMKQLCQTSISKEWERSLEEILTMDFEKAVYSHNEKAEELKCQSFSTWYVGSFEDAFPAHLTLRVAAGLEENYEKTAAALKRLYEADSANTTGKTINYCNTGVLASLGWFVLHELEGNQQAQLYDGSMHAWSTADPEAQVVALPELPKEAVDSGAEESPRRKVTAGAGRTAPRVSLRTLVDMRRDVLRDRRKQAFDAFTGRRFRLPPAIVMRDDMLDGQREGLRAFQRARRDAVQAHHDAYRSLYDPWSMAFREDAEARYFASQMEYLDRMELMDSLSHAHPYGW